jgi:hypothetical protein
LIAEVAVATGISPLELERCDDYLEEIVEILSEQAERIKAEEMRQRLRGI